MITILVWCDDCATYHKHAFTPAVLPSVDDAGPDGAYWLKNWGENPYYALDGNFNPEWN